MATDNDTGWLKGRDGIWTSYTRVIQDPYRTLMVSNYGWRDWRWTAFHGSLTLGTGRTSNAATARAAATACATI